jgi:hypothetical protein
MNALWILNGLINKQMIDAYYRKLIDRMKRR